MSDQHEPMRLRAADSGAAPLLKQLLQSASRMAPSPAHQHALEEAILRRIEAQAERDEAAVQATRPRGWFSRAQNIAKLVVVIGLAGAAGIGVDAWRSREPVLAPPGSEPASPQPTAASTPAVATTQQPGHAAASVAASGGEPPATPVPTVDEQSAALAAGADESKPRRTASSRGPRQSSVRPTQLGETRGTASHSPAAGPHDNSSAPEQTNIASELELLARAQRALRDDPEEALELTRLHARAYPTGAFVEEREAIGIEALVATGQSDLARERGREFLSQHKSSAYAARVARVLQAVSD
jgi:hypothetical protein